MAEITKQKPGVEGGVVTFTGASTADTVQWESDLYLIAWNDGGASARSVTVVSQFSEVGKPGVTSQDTVVSVGIDEVAFIPIGAPVYRDGSGFVNVTVGDATNLKYAVLEIDQ